MDNSWTKAREKFWELLDAIETVRQKLHCNISSAWFRGHDNSDWQLRTSLYRINNMFVDLDRAKQLEIYTYEKRRLQIKLKKNAGEQSELRHFISQRYKSGKTKLKTESERLSRLKTAESIIKTQLSDLNLKSRITESIISGEPEAFVNWMRRSEKWNRNSWEILAEMQHYKVGTRMLDWTENLSIAMYFAIEKYIDSLLEIWNSDNYKKNNELPFIIPENLPTPCIWILNPYELARYSTKDTRIIDPSISEALDYFKAFFVNKTWPFRCHIPIYPPWRNPRIIAQQGMFTVQGWDTRPLDEQLKNVSYILDKIEISPEAAVYAAKHLLNFQGIDRFFIYRDMDNLGVSVKDKFLFHKRN